MKPLPTRYRLALYFFSGVLLLVALNTVNRHALTQAQQSENEAGPSGSGASEPAPVPSEPAPAAASPTNNDGSINLIKLYFAGGIFMYPITALSILAATFVVERFLGLRRARVMPEELVTALGQLGGSQGGFDPRKAYRLCQQFPSAAATVLRAMLLKIGRPLSEIEHTVKETADREATRLYANVRWINLAASMAPLLGLLGTVQGMIMAFHMMTIMDENANQAKILAEGIYTALVTTFAGLVVAIPAAMFSHYFEGRIQTMFHEIDELVFSLLPQVERYEGRVRFSRQGSEDMTSSDNVAPPPAPVGAGK
jgi:biopolymer transport protein ExbB